ncbi:MAG: hypothetical protein H0U66_06330 [Gemmatimonadaceae bacterium]|nr:hypothetical protein [Gemmatimonadaceae bacterium]
MIGAREVVVHDADLSIGEPPAKQRILHLRAYTTGRHGEDLGPRIECEGEPWHARDISYGRLTHAGAQHVHLIVPLTLGVLARRARATDDDLPELFAMNLEQRHYRCVRRSCSAVVPAPPSVILHQAQKSRFIDVVPIPLGLERRDRLRRTWQQLSRIVAGGVVRAKPVARDDPEVAAAAAGVRPPELAIRIGALARRDHDDRVAILVDRHDLDCL